ncbi:MAG: RNA polymerase sigma factor [Cyclobacteriaceae bacterium]
MNSNSEKLDQEFPSYQTQLKSFILRITADKQLSEDIVQDAYIKAVDKIESFRGESSLKTWVFSIAANLAKDKLRSKKQWPEEVLDVCKKAALGNREFFEEAMAIRHSSPQGEFEIKEHIAFCFTCIGKTLPIEQQLCVLLKEVYQFRTKEVAQILGISEAMVKHHLHLGRTKMTTIFEKRCSIINKKGMCHQCTELNAIFNPKQNAQEELTKIKMAKDAENLDKEKLFDLRADIVNGIDPFESNAAELQLHHLEHNRKVMEQYIEKAEKN